MITWETWSNFRLKRVCVHYNDKGQFMKNNFHFPKEWIHKVSLETKRKISISRKGHSVSREIKNKISNTLKGLIFSEERKINISKGTIKANYKWAKTCKHGIMPLYKCKECFKETQKKTQKRYKLRQNLLKDSVIIV